MTLQEMREARAKLVNKITALGETAADQWDEDNQEEFDGLKNKITAIDKHIDRYQEIQGLGANDPDMGDETPEQMASRATNGAHIEAEAKAVYKNLGEQMADVYAMTLDAPGASRARDRHVRVTNAAGAKTGVDSEGGYLVETDKATGIMESAIETGVLASRVTRQTIGANSDRYSYLSAKDRDRSDGLINGISVYRKGEDTAMVSSGKAQLEEHELRLEDMYGLLYVTNRMLKDAAAMASYAQRNLRKQFAFKLDREIWEGTGAGQCLGVMNSDLPITVAKEAEQTTDTVVGANVVNMLARFRGDIRNAAWFVNQEVLTQLPLMTVGDQPVFIPGGSFSNAPFGVLFGRPIVPLEFCEGLGTENDIVLADFSEYLLIEKGGMEEQQSMHVRFLTDEMAFRFIARNNGQPMYDEPITPFRGTFTLSPFVKLATRD